MNTRNRTHAAAFAALIALGLAGCSTQASSDEGVDQAGGRASFPVSVEVPGTPEPLVIDEEPARIAVLSPDAAIALHELGLTDRLIAVPESAENTTLNPYADEMVGVEHVVAGENRPEPEQVLSWEPDLVVVTARHTGEQDASERLAETGVPVLTLTNGWASSDAVVENIELLGEATGASEQADALAEEIREGVSAVRELSAAADETPSVAILSNQARAPFINAGSSLVSELVVNGGGSNAADTIGIERTGPIQPEQLVAANPDYIMLVDVTGKGEHSFDSLLGNPAVAALPAVQKGRLKMFPGRDVYALAGREVVSGSEGVLEWLHPEFAE